MNQANSEFLPLEVFKNEFRHPEVSVASSLSISNDRILVKFALKDPMRIVKAPVKTNMASTRKDNLWQSTCFELFLSAVDSSEYFEINLSPWGGWNAYHFQSYRSPQPAKPTDDIQIQNLGWEDNQLTATLILGTNKSVPTQLWNCSLSAVVETTGAEKLYFATKHCRDKPDFHARESFVLNRRSV